MLSMFFKKTAQSLTYSVLAYQNPRSLSQSMVCFAIWGFIQICGRNLNSKIHKYLRVKLRWSDEGIWMEKQRNQRIVELFWESDRFLTDS